MGNINLNIEFSHPDAVSVTVRYARIDNTNAPVYTTIPNVTVSPLVISNLANGQYRIGIKPNYSDGRVCSESFQDTSACPAMVSFNATYDGTNFNITFNAPSTAAKVQLTIIYPNGGQSTQQYDNVPGTIVVAPPSLTYGSFTLSMQAVCDADSGFFGAQSAPIVLNVAPPNNVSLYNATATPIAPLSVTVNSTGSTLVFTTSNLPNSGSANFYIPDGNYSTIVINFGTGTLSGANLVTGTGTYVGVVGTNSITFTGVNMLGGATITITT